MLPETGKYYFMFIINIRQVNEMHLQSAKLYSSEQLVPLSTNASIC